MYYLVPYCTPRYNMVLCRTVLHGTVPYCTVLFLGICDEIPNFHFSFQAFPLSVQDTPRPSYHSVAQQSINYKCQQQQQQQQFSYNNVQMHNSLPSDTECTDIGYVSGVCREVLGRCENVNNISYFHIAVVFLGDLFNGSNRPLFNSWLRLFVSRIFICGIFKYPHCSGNRVEIFKNVNFILNLTIPQ